MLNELTDTEKRVLFLAEFFVTCGREYNMKSFCDLCGITRACLDNTFKSLEDRRYLYDVLKFPTFTTATVMKEVLFDLFEDIHNNEELYSDVKALKYTWEHDAIDFYETYCAAFYGNDNKTITEGIKKLKKNNKFCTSKNSRGKAFHYTQ